MTEKSKILLTPDFCVIGGGSGGLSFAAGAAQMGARVVLVERGAMGGDCLNAGCVPSKSLIAASHVGHVLNTAQKFGWEKVQATLNFQKTHDYVHGVMAGIAPHDSVERFEGLGVTVLSGVAEFVDNRTMETQTHRIQAKRFILATGSHPFVPPIPGLVEAGYVTNETIFDLRELPAHLVVIGGGPIGMELAQAFVRFGSTVTVLEGLTALPKDDPELTGPLKKILIQEGIDLREQVKIERIEPDKTVHGVDRQGKAFAIPASHILVATGRRANVADLNLEVGQVASSPMGIQVNAQLRTTNKRVYALGDCTGGYQFTHVAGYHAGIALRNTIFRLGTKVQTVALPWVTYTDPELSHVGCTESQAVAQNMPHKVLRLSFQENDRAWTMGRTEGQIKVVVTPKGHVLGASILGPQAGELIYPWVMAIQNGLKLSAMAQSLAPYPTLNDINKRIAGAFYGEKLFSPTTRGIVQFLLKVMR